MQANRNDLSRFISALFRYADEGTWVSFRVFDEERRDVPPVIEALRMNGSMDALADAAVKMAEVAARRQRPSVFAPPVATFTVGSHAREADLACALALSVELDHDAQNGLMRLRGILGQPTVVVESGGVWRTDDGASFPKLHVYWRYSEAAVGEDILLSKRARVAAAALVGGDPTNGPDSHPIRWPGSWHRKAEPKLARIVELNDGAEIELRDAVPDLEGACRAAGRSPRTVTQQRNATIAAGLVDPAKLMALQANSREFKKAWDEGYKKPSGVPDHSQCDWWLAIEAARTGWSDEEIAGLISAFRTRVGEGDRATSAYLGHTIGRVRAFLAKGSTLRDEALLRAEEELDEGKPEDAIETLGRRLGIPLARVIITGMQTAIAYSFALDDGRRVLIGSAGHILAQSKVREHVLAATNVVLNPVKQVEWDNVVRLLVAVAQREDAADSDPVKELMAAIDDYADPRTPWGSDDAANVFAIGGPLVRDGQLMVTVRHFMRWCQGRGVMTSLREEDIRARLRIAGWVGKRLSRRTAGGVKCAFYWCGSAGITNQSNSITENEPENNDLPPL